jgi:uracil phosphoribosyltransferase
VTPEYLQLVRERHPQVQVFALRLDRGLSAPEVLGTAPGTVELERALTDHGYIVPGGGGFGELLNNSWV